MTILITNIAPLISPIAPPLYHLKPREHLSTDTVAALLVRPTACAVYIVRAARTVAVQAEGASWRGTDLVTVCRYHLLLLLSAAAGCCCDCCP